MRYKELQPSELLQHFRQIPPNQHFAIIRFFEQNGEEIEELPTEEYVILLSYYVDALFEEGGFEGQVLRITAELLELSIVHGVQFVDGQDVYLRSLYHRGAAFLFLGEVEKAQEIAEQLWRLSPHEAAHVNLLRACLTRQRPNWVQHTSAVAMAALLVALLVSFAEILLPESWHAEWAQSLQFVGQSFFLLSASSLAAGLLAQYYYVGARIRQIGKRRL